jgi:2-polyprenyl-6-hydroxyphenyl methylase/3-demethylubiquinone-9 3-methyltransferase
VPRCPRYKDAHVSAPTPPSRTRNDPLQYEDLVDEWWAPRGKFAMLHWIAEARAALVPPADREGALLVDFGCGAGLLAPRLIHKGYTHVGFDLSSSALELARSHGVVALRADVRAAPFADRSADVVCAGEILEHVAEFDRVVDEACRVLRPGGVLVVDTIADTLLARVLAVELAERVPGGAPRGIHDPHLFVDRERLVQACAAGGVDLELHGLRPGLLSLARFWTRGSSSATMVPTWSTAVLFQGIGRKRR